MSDRDSCRHHFEHVKQTRPFTEREYMQCTKCGLRNPLGLFQHWDTERDGPAVRFNRNSYAYQYEPEIMPKKSAIDYLIEAFKDAFTAPFKPKRQPITKVRRIWRGPNPITGRTFSTWYWQCALCDHNMKPRETGSTHYGELCFTWADAHRRATHHAHNHH